MIEEAIKNYYGERCPEYDADCVVCQAWEQYSSMAITKRFLLFTSATYYPYGGMDDCKGEFASLNDAVDHATSSDEYSATEGMHILEIGNKLIVWQCDRTGQVTNSIPLSEYIKIESD